MENHSFDYDTSFESTIKEKLGESSPFRTVICYERIDSTNDAAKRLVQEGCRTPAVVTAGTQTLGRGRMGKQFYSPPQTGLYFSVLLFTKKHLSDVVTVTSAVSVMTERAIRSLTGTDPKIKWVNDIVLKGKKIAGILCESCPVPDSSLNGIVVGIGINISTSSFPLELQQSAGSINVSDLDRAALVAEVALELYDFIDHPDFSSYLDEYKSRSLVLGREITFIRNGVSQNATAVDIDSAGGLVVLLPDGRTETLFTGEISVRLL